MRTEVGKDLADIRGKIAELVGKKVAAEDQLKRVDIARLNRVSFTNSPFARSAAPVAPGEQMMLIVSVDVLNLEAQIQPQDVDQVYIGQTAILGFSSFSQRTTLELNGQ